MKKAQTTCGWLQALPGDTFNACVNSSALFSHNLWQLGDGPLIGFTTEAFVLQISPISHLISIQSLYHKVNCSVSRVSLQDTIGPMALSDVYLMQPVLH